MVGLLIFGLVPTALIIYQQLQVDEGKVSSHLYSKDSLRTVKVSTLLSHYNFQFISGPLVDLNEVRNATMK